MAAAALPVVVIGAGPVGLAAAAELLERGLDPLVLERSGEVGASVADWGHVRLFSPWRYDVDRAAARLLERSGWTAPDPEAHPTGAELRKLYLQPLAMVPELEGRVRLRHRVMAITRRDTNATHRTPQWGWSCLWSCFRHISIVSRSCWSCLSDRT